MLNLSIFGKMRAEMLRVVLICYVLLSSLFHSLYIFIASFETLTTRYDALGDSYDSSGSLVAAIPRPSPLALLSLGHDSGTLCLFLLGCDTPRGLEALQLLALLRSRPSKYVQRGCYSAQSRSWEGIPDGVCAIPYTPSWAVPCPLSCPCLAGLVDGRPPRSASWDLTTPPAFAGLSAACSKGACGFS